MYNIIKLLHTQIFCHASSFYIDISNILVYNFLGSLQEERNTDLFHHYSPTSGIHSHTANGPGDMTQSLWLVFSDRSVFHEFNQSPSKAIQGSAIITSCVNKFHRLIVVCEAVSPFVPPKYPANQFLAPNKSLLQIPPSHPHTESQYSFTYLGWPCLWNRTHSRKHNLPDQVLLGVRGSGCC